MLMSWEVKFDDLPAIPEASSWLGTISIDMLLSGASKNRWRKKIRITKI